MTRQSPALQLRDRSFRPTTSLQSAYHVSGCWKGAYFSSPLDRLAPSMILLSSLAPRRIFQVVRAMSLIRIVIPNPKADAKIPTEAIRPRVTKGVCVQLGLTGSELTPFDWALLSARDTRRAKPCRPPANPKISHGQLPRGCSACIRLQQSLNGPWTCELRTWQDG
jgi:hypothetical protein